MSLAQFADLLNTNVGQLCMAESGLRSLPPASMEIVTDPQKALTSTKAGRQLTSTVDKKNNDTTTIPEMEYDADL